MRALAEYILRGRTQATWVAVFAAAVPFLFWLSAATVALVTLRKGAQTGAGLLMWAALPALGWWFWLQDPRALVVIAMAWGMAVVLRNTVSWQQTLFGGVALGVVAYLLVPVLLPELHAELVTALADAFKGLPPDVTEQMGDRFDSALGSFVSGAFAVSHLLFAILSLMFARHAQAMLFNPGGFRQEFHELRMSPAYAAIAVLAILVGPMVQFELVGLVPVILVPLLIAGFALVHGTVAKRGLGIHWLIAFYAVAILMGPSTLFLLMVLAAVDSWVNFRGRIGA